jgi:hypothetical protein
MSQSIGGIFLPVKAYLGIGKQGLAMQLGTGGGTGRGRSFEKSAQRLVESPDERAFLSVLQTDLCGTPFFTMRYAWMYWSQEY